MSEMCGILSLLSRAGVVMSHRLNLRHVLLTVWEEGLPWRCCLISLKLFGESFFFFKAYFFILLLNEMQPSSLHGGRVCFFSSANLDSFWQLRSDGHGLVLLTQFSSVLRLVLS